mmetsp:Transcript_5909/g.9614  ORF Transcript_5909/g.9614 Transcript_5909/m.9614 type:complete len:184 (+) Transcript_5909:1963-2514(+)
MGKVEVRLQRPLTYIIDTNKQELMGYAFQILSLFAANSGANSEMYQKLMQALIKDSTNWDKDNKYLIPSLTDFVITMICKYTDFTKQFSGDLINLCKHLMSQAIRMEGEGLKIASAMLERMGMFDPAFVKDIFFAIFSSLHFYRNNTKGKVIPTAIMREVLVFFATFVINFGIQDLINVCNQI